MTSEAAERITLGPGYNLFGDKNWNAPEVESCGVEYVRADLAAPGWQPIDTAPRDGAVLLYFGNRQWRDMHGNTVRLSEPRNTIERIEAGWCEDGDIHESGTGHSVWEEWREPENFPTHWMPMPTPPRDALGEEDT